jgi:transcriptional regulator with XRE-family HTH domain
MSETTQKVTIEEIEKELQPTFEEISNNPDDLIISQVPEKCKILLSKNITFLRHYIGFEKNLRPYIQEEFAKLMNISVPTLKKWEGANNLPSRFSLKAILQLSNKMLFGREVLKMEHILCKNLVSFIKEVQKKEILEKADISSEEDTEALDNLKKSENMILKALNTMNDACLIIQDSNIVFANNSAIRLFSGNDVLATNYTLADLLLPDFDVAEFLKAYGNGHAILSENKEGLFFEKALRKTNGVLFNALVVKNYMLFDTKPALQYMIKEK